MRKRPFDRCRTNPYTVGDPGRKAIGRLLKQGAFHVSQPVGDYNILILCRIGNPLAVVLPNQKHLLQKLPHHGLRDFQFAMIPLASRISGQIRCAVPLQAILIHPSGITEIGANTGEEVDPPSAGYGLIQKHIIFDVIAGLKTIIRLGYCVIDILIPDGRVILHLKRQGAAAVPLIIINGKIIPFQKIQRIQPGNRRPRFFHR